MWPMPIPDAIVDRVKASKIADLLQHDAIRWGGGLFAAAYLREFTAGLPWAHLDIAGPAFTESEKLYRPSGGTGVMVRTLLRYLEEQ
jgi:leucyl aminopeptidase